MLPEKQLQQLHVGHQGVYNDPQKNCCWAAACLQVLLRDPVFGEFILSLDTDALPKNPHGEIVKQVVKLTLAFASQHKAPLCLEELLAAWAQRQPEVHQEHNYYPYARVQLCALDASVFLLSCFEEAFTEACDFKALSQFTQMFRLRTLEVFVCGNQGCLKRSLKPAQHSVLVLPIKNSTASLGQALADYFFVEDQEDRRCDACGPGGSKSDRVTALPAKLMIQLKRAQAQSKKCCTALSYPAFFNMAPFCTQDVTSNGYQRTWYSLTAAILHQGSGTGGHYTCFTKVALGEYMYHDDACEVQRISEATALNYKSRVHGLMYTIMPESGQEPTLATLPEPSEVAGPTGPDGVAKVFLPWETPPWHVPDITLPAPASSKPTAVKQLEPVAQQSPAQRPVSVAALEHTAALQEKARAAKSKLAEAEAKLAARQSRYALAEGGSIHQRNTSELPEVGASSANPLALTALSRKEQRKARQALQSAQKAAAPSDQPRPTKRALLRAAKLNMPSPSLASISEAAHSQMVLVPAAQSSFPTNPVPEDIQPNYDSCSTQGAEEVREEGKDVSAGEVEAQAVPEEVEIDSQADATGLAQSGGPASGVEKIKMAMDSVPQSPVRTDNIGAHWPSVTVCDNTQGASQEAPSGEAESSSASIVAEVQQALPVAADEAQEHSWPQQADGAGLSGVQQPAPVHQRKETCSLAKDADVSGSLNDAGTRLSLREAHGSAPTVEEGNMELHSVPDGAMQASESEAAFAQSKGDMAEEEAHEPVHTVEGDDQDGLSLMAAARQEADRLILDEAHGSPLMLGEGNRELHGVADGAMQASESEAAFAQNEVGLAEEQAQERVQAVEGDGQDGMSLVATATAESDRHSSDAALSSRMTADAEDNNRISTAASTHRDDAEHTASPEEVQLSSNAAMSATAPDEPSGSTRLAASQAEVPSSLSAMSADTLPQSPFWSGADAATIDSLLSGLVSDAVSQTGMPDQHAANSGAADAQTRSGDGGPCITQTAAVYQSAAFKGHQVDANAGAAMPVNSEGGDSRDVQEMNGFGVGSGGAGDQDVEGHARVGVQGLQANGAAPDRQDHVDAAVPEVGMLETEGVDEGSTAGIRLHQEVAHQQEPQQQTPPEPISAQQNPPLPIPPQQDPPLATRPQHESIVQTPSQQGAALQDIPQQPRGRLLQQSSEEAAMPEPACKHKPGQQDSWCGLRIGSRALACLEERCKQAASLIMEYLLA